MPLLATGGTLTGPLITAASNTAAAGLNLPPGAAPTSPNNGDIWSTSAGFFGRVNGATVGPFASGTSGSFTATSPLVVTFPGGGVVNYAFNFSVPNTFLAQQTNQGATTTQPGWYAQLAGDTTARVRVGLNSTDIASIALGSGSGARDLLLERAGPAALRLGSPDAAAPVAQTLGVQNVLGGTSNTAGTSLTIAGSQGTGTGLGGDILFKTAPAGSTGSTQNALSTALHVYGSGGVATGAATDPGAGNLNLASGSLLNNGTSPTGTGAYVRATSPSLVTPLLGVAAGTSLALGGATIGANGLAVTGTTLFNSAITYGGVTLSNSVTGTGAMVLGTAPTIGGLTVTGSLTATGLVTNADLANSGLTLGSTALTLGATTTTVAGLTLTTPTVNGAALSGTLTGSPTLSGNPTLSGVPVLSGISSGTCASGIGIDASNNIIKDACPGAASSIQVGSTTVTSGTTLNLLYDNAGVLGNATLASFLTAGNFVSITGTTNATISVNAAAKSDMITGSSIILAVTPGEMSFSPYSMKVHGLLVISGSTATLQPGSAGISSVSYTSTGQYKVNFSTSFANTTYDCTSSATGGASAAFLAVPGQTSYTASQVSITVTQATAFGLADPSAVSIQCGGLQ